MRRRESRRRSRHNRTSKSPAMWPGFLAAQIVREYSLLLIFLCKIFPEKLDKARGGRRGILDSPFQSTPPARGATADIAGNVGIRQDFNPRPPRGGRRSRLPYPCGPTPLFQSTPPARGATIRPKWCEKIISGISIHAPREGGDGRAVDVDAGGFDISIHAPREGGDHTRFSPLCYWFISIHAPREGGDSKDAQFYLWIFDK